MSPGYFGDPGGGSCTSVSHCQLRLINVNPDDTCLVFSYVYK